MPTYQYACTECGHSFEQFQSFSDDALTVCPACEGRLRKVFNAVGVVFKGSGFYRNDSRTDGKSTGGGAAEVPRDLGLLRHGSDSSSSTRRRSRARHGSGRSPSTQPRPRRRSSDSPSAA